MFDGVRCIENIKTGRALADGGGEGIEAGNYILVCGVGGGGWAKDRLPNSGDIIL